MEWQVRIKDKTHAIEIPSYLLAQTVLSAKIDHKNYLFRWNALHQTFFVSEEGSKLERCLRTRNLSLDQDHQSDEKLLRIQIATKDSTVFEAIVMPVSHSRAVRSKTKKKRADKQFSPLTGKVLKLYVKPGDTVRKGDQVAIIEAMKMENKILSEMTGVVKEIRVSESSKINMGDEIFSTSSLKSQ